MGRTTRMRLGAMRYNILIRSIDISPNLGQDAVEEVGCPKRKGLDVFGVIGIYFSLMVGPGSGSNWSEPGISGGYTIFLYRSIDRLIYYLRWIIDRFQAKKKEKLDLLQEVVEKFPEFQIPNDIKDRVPAPQYIPFLAVHTYIFKYHI